MRTKKTTNINMTMCYKSGKMVKNQLLPLLIFI